MKTGSLLRRLALSIVVLSVFSSVALADTITYAFNMNTSSLVGTKGYLDMQFSEAALVSGGGTTAYNTTATAAVTNFQTDGLLTSENPYTTLSPFGSYDASGDVSGILTQPVVFSASGDGALNDYSQGITFGNALSFDLTLSGQGVSTPVCPVDMGGTACSEPAFLLDFYDAAGDSYLFTNDPSGSTASGWIAGGVNLNADTSTTAFTNPGAGGTASDLSIAAGTSVSPVPEPATWALVTTGLICIPFVLRRGRLTCRHRV